MNGTTGAPVASAIRGFTLTELLMVIVLVAILAAVVVPRLLGGSPFDTLGFVEETQAILRYAQRSALAMQRTVCVAFGANSITLSYASAYGSSTCDTSLAGPTGSPAAYQVTGRGTSSFSPVPANFSFDRLGQPSAGQNITIAGGRTIRVEPGTGYVY
jgi:MSHA pilin protein MshC